MNRLRILRSYEFAHEAQLDLIKLHDEGIAAVLINVSTYQNMIDKIELMEELLEAERQIIRGETVPHEQAKRKLHPNLNAPTH